MDSFIDLFEGVRVFRHSCFLNMSHINTQLGTLYAQRIL